MECLMGDLDVISIITNLNQRSSFDPVLMLKNRTIINSFLPLKKSLKNIFYQHAQYIVNSKLIAICTESK